MKVHFCKCTLLCQKRVSDIKEVSLEAICEDSISNHLFAG